MAATLPGGAGFVMRRECGRIVLALFTIGVLGCERHETLVHRPITVTVSELLTSDSPVWSALATDLDGDGLEELVLAGHRGARGPGYCRIDGRAPCSWQPFLAPALDRHHCTAGDIDADGDLDLYCTAGADRGSGAGPNEVWLQVGPMRFESAADARGAREASSRGRLATFLDFNGDAWPDLVSTAWGTRSDGAENRSKLWINREGLFVPADTTLPPGFGVRCLSVADVNADGSDDIIGCPAEAGLLLLLNRDGAKLATAAIGVDTDWYWDAQFKAATANRPSLLVSTGGVPGEMFIEITMLTPALDVDRRRRIACRQTTIDEEHDIYCGRLLLHDADGDGHTDILVSRHRGWRHEEVLGDAPDLLIFGPDYREFSRLPTAQTGAGELLLATDVGIVQVNAGESWNGSVVLLQIQP